MIEIELFVNKTFHTLIMAMGLFLVA